MVKKKLVDGVVKEVKDFWEYFCYEKLELFYLIFIFFLVWILECWLIFFFNWVFVFVIVWVIF